MLNQMNTVLNALPETTRQQLRSNMHKVAAVMANQSEFPIGRDEITIKEAAYLIGANFWKHYLEKRAMLDGIMTLHTLTGK